MFSPLATCVVVPCLASAGRSTTLRKSIVIKTVLPYCLLPCCRDTLESNNARVMWWAIVEAVTIFATSFVGAAVVRAWFKRPSMLPGKV